MKTLLKYLVCVLLAVGLGIATGWIFQKVEASTITEHFFNDQWKPKSAELDRPIALVDGESIIEVEAVASDATIEREFIIKNEGLRELEVWLEGTSGDAISSDLAKEKRTILPNGTYPISVTIDVSKLKLEPGQPFDQSVTLGTSDSENESIKLSVQGKIAE